ncbi:hypothetical protein NliqN6_3080 [Naganishia liquefaciens]|uniref:non-specific serine/threonine protein kinase n=1 Tax=Naganishia liquefaciens TaxID=104408 RepID=A0A8H3YEW7_9TREE|nr:hypothetical protein NliqN6_3080 [Naganishia liquefaciens]
MLGDQQREILRVSKVSRGHTSPAREPEQLKSMNQNRIFRSSNWLISVSSKESDIGTSNETTVQSFVVIISEPGRDHTLFRSARDFQVLHESLLITGFHPPALPDFTETYALRKELHEIDRMAAGHGEDLSKTPKKRPSIFMTRLRSFFQEPQPAATVSDQKRSVHLQFATVDQPPISPPHSPVTANRSTRTGCQESILQEPQVEPHRSLSMTPSNSSNDNSAGHIRGPLQAVQKHALKLPSDQKYGVFELQTTIKRPSHLSLHSSRGASGRSARECQQVDRDIGAPESRGNEVLTPSLPLDDLEFNRLEVDLADYLISLCSDPVIEGSDALCHFLHLRGPGTFEDTSLTDHGLQSCQKQMLNGSARSNSMPADNANFKIAEGKVSANSGTQRQTVDGDSGNGMSHIAPSCQPILGQSHILTQSKSLEDRAITIVKTVRDSGAVNEDTGVRASTSNISGEINYVPFESELELDSSQIRSEPRKVTIDDFDLIQTLGKGCAGKVVLVRHKTSRKVFALKAMVKRQVIVHSELRHAFTEQAVLKRLSCEKKGTLNPFVVKLWCSFHDEHNLYLALEFHPGGDLATQLSKWGRLGRDRARFYTAEIVEGVEGLHAAGVIYRDLKPENILLARDGHIVLVDFGLAADFYPNHRKPGCVLPHWMAANPTSSDGPDRPQLHHHLTDGLLSSQKDCCQSFVGTAEYLAPEVIKGLPYSYEVDWWSLGTMTYELLMGHTPFWANNHSDMYMKVIHDELVFPMDDALDRDTKSFIRGVSSTSRRDSPRNSTDTLTRIKTHPYFSIVNFDHVRHRRYIPPYIPLTDTSLEYDTSNFDKTFLTMDTNLKRDSTVLKQQKSGSQKISTFDESAFAVWDYAALDMDIDIGEDQSADLRSPRSAVSRGASSPSSDDDAPERGSESSSISISSLNTQDGLGSPAMRNIPEETGEEYFSTETAKAQGTAGAMTQAQLDRAVTTEQTSILLQRIHTLATEPGIISSSRHSRDMSHASTQYCHRASCDDWTFLDVKPEEQAPNGASQAGQSLSARGVVDKYRLVLRKRTGTALHKKPSWRSPTSSLIFGKATPSAYDNDNGKLSPGFLSPLSPALADIKSRLKGRTGTKRKASTKVPPLEASTPGRGHEACDVQGKTAELQRILDDRHESSRSADLAMTPNGN